jgi:hypothetical protein
MKENDYLDKLLMSPHLSPKCTEQETELLSTTPVTDLCNVNTFTDIADLVYVHVRETQVILILG